jgi:tRNA1(Val) A37 N6-methylase TrmN6
VEKSKWDLSSFLSERCLFYQLKDGFRFGTDTFLLTSFVRIKGKEKLIDLGTGCGVIPILLLMKYPGIRAWGLDVLEESVELSKKNAQLNKVSDRFTPVRANVKEVFSLFKPGEFDVVVSNPPFIEKGKGEPSASYYRAVARQELTATLEDFIRGASYLLKNRGRFYLLLPTIRFTDAMVLLRKYSLEPKRLRFIYSYPGDCAKLFLLDSMKGGGKALEVEPPLVVYREKGSKEYTREVNELYSNFLK